MPVVSGTDMAISNSGYMILFQLKYKEGGDLTINFIGKSGEKLFTKIYKTAGLFGFSPTGDKYGVGLDDGIGLYRNNLLIGNIKEKL